MPSKRLLLLVVLTTGCAASTPREVFTQATQAFADGDVPRAIAHFSHRLLEARPAVALEDYYGVPDNRKGVGFFLRNHRFQLVRQSATEALAKVTWTTGRSEPVYFVLEDGAWKLDLPPGPSEPADGPPVLTSPNEPNSVR
ncbi:MAG: hypothetical protein AB7O52_09995 [Planctomycetota bacterium]